MPREALSGVIPPIITPVDDEDRVDEQAFRKVIQYLIEAGVNGIFVGGSTGEGPMLTLKEWARMCEIAREEVKSPVHLLAGVADTSTARMKEKIEILADMGYDNYVVTPTFYISLTAPTEFLRVFGECADAGGSMEMVAYNIPPCTNSSIPLEILIDITRRGWIRYCKDSSGNRDLWPRLIKEGGKYGLEVFMGHEGSMAEALTMGAVGLIGICSNYEPKTFIRLYEAAKRKDEKAVKAAQERIEYVRDQLYKGNTCFVAGVKHALSMMGMGNGKPISPLEPASEESKKNIAAMTPPPW